MADSQNPFRLLVVITAALCLAGGLYFYAAYKEKESRHKSAQCQEKCFGDGFTGYDFQWNMFGSPKCKCFDTTN